MSSGSLLIRGAVAYLGAKLKPAFIELRLYYSTGYKTDHPIIDISIAVHSNPRGPGFWQLNTSFLNEIDYFNQIKSTFQDVKEEYQNDDTMNPALLWEIMKLKV